MAATDSVSSSGPAVVKSKALEGVRLQLDATSHV
jgi:hypothetical protein